MLIRTILKGANFSKFVHFLKLLYPTKTGSFCADKIDNFNNIDKNNQKSNNYRLLTECPFINFRFNFKFFCMHLNWCHQAHWREDIFFTYTLKNEFSQASCNTKQEFIIGSYLWKGSIIQNQLTFIDYRFIYLTRRH